MRTRSILLVRTIVFTFSAMLVFLSYASAGVKEKVLHSFNNTDGSNPESKLIADPDGNLYGTTAGGGANGMGCVFKLSLTANKSWMETVLYSFSGPDGSYPSAGVVRDQAGNLYGTTDGGGTFGLGVVFELSPSSNGWSEQVLYSFGTLGPTDGWEPLTGVILDAAGNLYGTTQLGGVISGTDDNGGTVFRLTNNNGTWTESLLYSFPGEYQGPDGDLPGSGVVIDGAGNIYGTTQAGGAYGIGAVYELSPQADGTYTEQVIFSFDGTHGNRGNSTPVFGPAASFAGGAEAARRLYATAAQGGSNGCGVVFELNENSSGAWSESILHSFTMTDGCAPQGPVAFDRAGNLYVTAQSGGASGDGGVYKFIPRAGAQWWERILEAFDGTNGSSPYAGVLLDAAGDVFGTTNNGGEDNYGTVYEIIP